MAQAYHSTSVLDFIHERAARFADRTALCIKEGGAWREMTYRELSRRAVELGSYLIELGIQPGDRIALIAEGKPEWGVAFFGAIRAGAVVVPLDIKLTETEITNILLDCAPKVVLSDGKHLPVIDAVRKKVTSIEHVYNVDSNSQSPEHQTISSLKAKQAERSCERKPEDVALIVYTSGTTGSPKGVMTTFGNLMFQVGRFKEMAGLDEHDRFLSILPLNHLLELTGGFLGMLNQGATICFCHSLFPQEIIKSMAEKEITGMVAVPLFFKTLKGAIEREVKKLGELADKFQAGLAKADGMPMAQRRQMFAPIHQQFGGKLRVFVCGGAPLDTDVAQFFERIGVPMLQGYGLTETSPVISGNSLEQNRIGSVGKPLPGVEVKIDKRDAADSEGEILTRGPHIMKGYYRRDDLTGEVIDADGWFHTGDIGHLDEEGFLHITGRIKNLIVLGGGKKVFPEEVEMALSPAVTIKEVCVLPRKQADGFKSGTEEVCAVVVPADSLVAQHKGDAAHIQQAVKEEIDKLSANLAAYKRPTRVFFYDGELPKTVTRKVKRAVVAEWLNSQK